MTWRRWSLGIAAALLAALASCFFGPLPCESGASCPDGQACVDGACVAEGEGEG